MCDVKKGYTIYTHDEFGHELEFEISDMKSFLDSQENLPTLLDELESKVAFQIDLKYGLENNLVGCYDKNSKINNSEEQIEYLGIAISSNIEVIEKIREYLGLNPEPNIKPSMLTTEFRKANARNN